MLLAVSICAGIAWLAIAVLPWQPHRMRERLEASSGPADLSDVTVLIPARDEAELIGHTLAALARQGFGLEVIIVDDESSDGTSEICSELGQTLTSSDDLPPGHWPAAFRCLQGRFLPSGWGGKLWALQQGLSACHRPYTLLLDADIALAPHTIPALLAEARARSVHLLSIMARLKCVSVWEKLLVPPFIFFFKLLYPFSLAQDPNSRVAAAAGGCVLVETEVLKQLGGFEDIRAELIDDCALAAKFKRAGHRIWVGVSESVRSLRSYPSLAHFWTMVNRTAFTQLRYSIVLLLLTTAIMILIFPAPIAVAILADSPAALLSVAALVCMCLVYWPTLRFYGLPFIWGLSLPAAGLLFLAMTWSSAINYWRGTRASWKSRSYDVAED